LEVALEDGDLDVLGHGLEKDERGLLEQGKGGGEDERYEAETERGVYVVDDLFGHVEVDAELVDEGGDYDDDGAESVG